MFMTVSSAYLFPYTDSNPIVNEVLPGFFHGQTIPNWVYVWRDFTHLSGFMSLLPFFAVIGALTGRIVWLFRSNPPNVVVSVSVDPHAAADGR
jgi:hypothetical protein